MKNRINRFLILVLVLSSCASKGKQDEKSLIGQGIPLIHLGDAVTDMRSVKLSEIADSVIYLPLETGDLLVKDKISPQFSSRYIYMGRFVFDWTGKAILTVGTLGQGPGEEVYLHKIVDKEKSFYSMADKLISYDENGKYNGKERIVVSFYPRDVGNAGPNLAMCISDTVLFLSPDFQILKERRVVDPWPEKTTILSGNRVLRYFTENNDSVLYYNYFNDTIFRVKSEALDPRWIVDLKDQKVAAKNLLGDETKRLLVGAKLYGTGSLDTWDYLKETDDKIRAFAAYETDNLVFILWLKLREFNEFRHFPNPILQVAYYNKKTGETVAVDGEGFMDDLSSLGTFYPLWGTHNDYMITSYWPFELREKMEEDEQSGKKIDPKLRTVLSEVKDEDNPILVMVHLKK